MPRINTVIEWIKCLASPKYATNTSLRITQEDEDRALTAMNVAIVIVSIAAAYYGGVCIARYRHLQQVREYNKTHHIKSTEIHTI